MAEWMQVALAAAAVAVSVGVPMLSAFLRASGAVTKNTAATENLTAWLKTQGAALRRNDDRLDDHEGRLVEIETVHKVLGCEKAP